MLNDVQTVSVDEVLRIHDVLVTDFAESGDPMGGWNYATADCWSPP